MVDLLLKLLPIQKGEIFLANNNIKNIDNKVLNQAIGLVEQNPVILSCTLRENLLIANKKIEDKILLEVIEKVGLTPWFEGLPLGLESVLSEDGQSLSGGQKQRISIARQILKNPSILIMDEPTSSLDKEFVELMDALIDENFKDSTKIIISHHYTYKNARYLKVENKTIKELKHV